MHGVFPRSSRRCPSAVLHSPPCSCRLGGVPHAQRGSSGRLGTTTLPPCVRESDDGEPDDFEPGRTDACRIFAPEARRGAPSKTPLCRTVYGALPTVKSGGEERSRVFGYRHRRFSLSRRLPDSSAGVSQSDAFQPTYLPGRWLAGRPADWPTSQPARARASACLWGVVDAFPCLVLVSHSQDCRESLLHVPARLLPLSLFVVFICGFGCDRGLLSWTADWFSWAAR